MNKLTSSELWLIKRLINKEEKRCTTKASLTVIYEIQDKIKKMQRELKAKHVATNKE